MNTTDARNLINQTLNQLRTARRDENIVMDLLLELDRFETAVNHAVRNGLIDTMEAQAFRVTAESILTGTEPELAIITVALSRAVAAHPGVSRAARSLAIEIINAIEAGQREIHPGTDDALGRILSRAHEGARVH